LRDIGVYTLHRWGAVQCDRYLDALEECCRQVADVPELRRHAPDFPPYYRVLAGKHAIFYRVEDDGSILVVRLLHAAMLPELHLPEDDDGDENA
jgi:plasmid stabilization system protein ParE